MSDDLACPRCEGTGDWCCPLPETECDGHYCGYCEGTGRRLPTLAEWDALRAERDRYKDALRQVKNNPWAWPSSQSIARAALDGDA